MAQRAKKSSSSGFQRKLQDIWKKGQKAAAKNPRGAIIGGLVVAALLVVSVAFAFSGSGDAKTSASSAVAPATGGAKAAIASTGKSATAAKADPLAAGRALFEAKKYEESALAFKAVLDATDEVEARFWLGKAYLETGKEFRGCRQLRKYVEMAPKGRYVSNANASLKKSCD